MPTAGETIFAGKVPGERIATAVETSNSGAINTTETVVMTVVAPVVVGRTYRVSFDGGFDLSVADDLASVFIREDSVTGTALQIRRMTASLGNNLQPGLATGEYTADATEDKTFVATFLVTVGGGDVSLSAGATFPAYLTVDYIRG